MDATGWTEGRDGDAPVYEERLRPRWFVWVVVWAFVACVAIAYGSAYGTSVGVVLGAAGIALTGLALLLGSPLIRVDDRVLRAGPARLPLTAIGAIEPLDSEALQDARSTSFDPRWYTLMRSWSTGTGLRVEVADERDPHPAWLISTKHPEMLASALQTAIQGNRSEMRESLRGKS